MLQWVHDQFYGACGDAAAEANGNLAFETIKSFYEGSSLTRLDFFDSKGKSLGSRNVDPGRSSVSLFQQPRGFASLESTYMEMGFQVRAWDSGGNSLGESHWIAARSPLTLGYAAPDPRGGILLAGNLAASFAETKTPTVLLYSTTASPLVAWGPRPLESRGQVLGTGVDVQGRSLVVTDGSARFGAGRVSAQWFDQGGNALTGEFDLLPGPSDGGQWFEGWPLIDGGLLIVRRSWSDGASDRAEKLALLKAGETRGEPVPAWMASRPNTRWQIASEGRAYAVLPLGAKDTACTQRLEIVAPDGTVCGARDYPIAAGNCATKGLVLGSDGTVIQPLPDSMEAKTEVSVGIVHTCTWRWWPQTLR
jgi:hypothetical protein